MPVLLVEDDGVTRENLAEQMALARLEVVTASSGTVAMEKLRRRDIQFEALVTDLHLGDGIGGLRVAEEMERRYPRARIVIVTGRFDLLDMCWHERGWILMAKPFAANRLIGALQAD